MQKRKLKLLTISLLTICLITSTICRSQTTIDQLTPKQIEEGLRKAVKTLELCEVKSKVLAETEQLVKLLKEKIAIKEAAISAYQTVDSVNAFLINSYKAEIKVLDAQLKLAQAELKKQNKFYRRQKRKTVFVAIAGPVVTAATILYLNK